MDFPPAYLSLGGVVFGSVILALTIQRWILREGHDWRALLPFILAALYGMLVILTAGGLLAGAAWLALWGANGLGDLTLIYGVGSTAPDTTRTRTIALTPGGAAMVVILTALMFGAWKWSKKLPRKKVAAGVLCGICFGLNAAVAGVMAVPLANTANLAGFWWTGV